MMLKYPCDKDQQNRCDVVRRERWEVRGANYMLTLMLGAMGLLMLGLMGLQVLANNQQIKRLTAENVAIRQDFKAWVEKTRVVMQEQYKLNERVLSGERL